MPTEPMMREVEMPELLEIEGGIFPLILAAFAITAGVILYRAL
jgi:hypothetical protein